MCPASAAGGVSSREFCSEDRQFCLSSEKDHQQIQPLMGHHTKPRPRPLRHRPQQVVSIFAHWGANLKVRLLLACVGWMFLGIALWILFFDTTPNPAGWTGWTFRDVALIFVAFVSLTALEQVGWDVTLHEVHALSGEPVRPLARNLGLVAAHILAMLIAVGVFGLKAHGLTWSYLGLLPLSLGWFFGALGLSLLCIVLGGALGLLVLRLLDRPLTNPQDDFILPPDTDKAEAPSIPSPTPGLARRFPWLGALLMFLLVAGAVPFFEEVLFRGVLFTWLHSRLGLWPAVLLSSALFGLAHLRTGPATAAATGAGGVILALAFYGSGSLWAAILIHAVNNGLKVGFLYAFRASGLKPQPAV
jgi:membrane protease YdiL (CAAX protease family)